MGAPTLVLVTGPPGSGKTTLAHALAAAIGCPALCRDEIKEGMVASSPGFVPAPSDPLTMRTYAVFFEAIGLLLRSEVTLVAEAAFQHALWERGLEPLTGLARTRVIRCSAPEDLARARQRARLAGGARGAHADAAALASPLDFDAPHLDVPTLDVVTAQGWQPTVAEIVRFCRP